MPSELMTSAEVAEYLQIHRSTLYKLIHRRQIPVFRIGADYRFYRDTIEKLITDREEKGRPPKSAPSAFARHSPASSVET